MGRPRTRPFLDGLPYLTTKSLRPFVSASPRCFTLHREDDLSAEIEVNSDKLVLSYEIHRHDGLQRIEEHVRLCREPRHFGGAQLYFECPRCARRASKLFLVGEWFRCRRCLRLPYFSQSLGEEQRLTRTFRRLCRKINPAADSDFWELPDRPKGMHWKTYERLTDKAVVALDRREEVMNVRLYWAMAKLLGMTP